MAEKFNPRLQALILEVVENQLAENNPPATKATLERLMEAGYSEKEAMKMIGAVVAEFIYDAMKDNVAFDVERFCSRLDELI